MRRLEREATPADLCESIGCAFVVESAGNAVADSGRGKFRIVLIAPTRRVTSHRKQHIKIVRVATPPCRSALVGAPTACFGSEFQPADSLAVAGDDVDDAEERIAAVDCRSGAGNEFNPLDEVDINRKLKPDTALAVDGVVEQDSVHHHQHAGVEVAQPPDAPHAQVAVVAVRSDVQTADAVQDVSQLAVAQALYVSRTDDGDRRGCFRCLLGELGRTLYIEVQQLFERQQCRILGAGCAWGRRKRTGQYGATSSHQAFPGGLTDRFIDEFVPSQWQSGICSHRSILITGSIRCRRQRTGPHFATHFLGAYKHLVGLYPSRMGGRTANKNHLPP